MEPVALEFVWAGTTDDRAQLNWIWRPDIRVNTGAHRTGTEYSHQDQLKSV